MNFHLNSDCVRRSPKGDDGRLPGEAESALAFDINEVKAKPGLAKLLIIN
jgi:hypothetical protein